MNQTTNLSTSWLARAARHLVLWSYVVLALVGCGQPDTRITEAQPGRGTATPELPADALLPGDEQVLQAIRGNLARPNLDPAARQGLEEKLAFEEHVIRERATALAVPTAVRDLNAPVPTEPLPEMPGPSVVTPLPDGGAIVDSGNYVTSRYLMENSWYYDQGRAQVVVWAGADNPEGPKPDPRQGILLVEERRLVDEDETWQMSAPLMKYPTPDRAGAARIIAAQGMRLTIETMAGQQYVFDVVQRRWEQPGMPTPTSTAPADMPTSTPLR